MFKTHRSALFVALLATLASHHAAFAQVKVVVTSKPIHALVAGVMGDVGTPQLLVDGTASPHTYALKPSDAKALSAASIVFRVSEGLEPFTARIFRTLPSSVRTVSLGEVAGLRLLPRRSGGPFEGDGHAHHKGHGHTHVKSQAVVNDPHVWLDPDNAKIMVRAIATALGEVSSRDSAAFAANAADLSAQLDTLAEALERELAPVRTRPFVVFHDSLQYLEKRFGLTAVGSVTVNPDEQPSARRLTDLRKKIASLSAVCVFAEPQFSRKVVDTIAEGTKARLGILDPEGTSLAPGRELYFDLMRKAAGSLRDCLLPR